MYILCIYASFNYLTELFIVIGYLAQEKLFCSHETLHLSVLEPAVFLQISGEQIIINFMYIASCE